MMKFYKIYFIAVYFYFFHASFCLGMVSNDKLREPTDEEITANLEKKQYFYKEALEYLRGRKKNLDIKKIYKWCCFPTYDFYMINKATKTRMTFFSFIKKCYNVSEANNLSKIKWTVKEENEIPGGDEVVFAKMTVKKLHYHLRGEKGATIFLKLEE